jgi:hypothetical protein
VELHAREARERATAVDELAREVEALERPVREALLE